jgi:hypothetical protein
MIGAPDARAIPRESGTAIRKTTSEACKSALMDEPTIFGDELTFSCDMLSFTHENVAMFQFANG